MIGNVFEYRDRTFCSNFLVTDSKLDVEIRKELLFSVADMYFDNIKQMDLRSDDYEGRIVDKGYSLLGTFGGRVYDIDLETEHGKSELRLMAGEKVGPSLN